MQNSLKTFRLFISSTFSDFKKEREILQTKIFPKIKKYCADKHLAFQPIDLRWGVSSEAQLDQKALALCLEEVRTCKTYPHPNFLIMIGDRYGWIPLPYAIEQQEFESIRDFISSKDETLTIEYDAYKINNDSLNLDNFHKKQKSPRTTSKLQLLDDWYILDKNQLPSSYILKQRLPNSEYEVYENWQAEERILRDILQTTVTTLLVEKKLSLEQQKKYFLSATEAEVEEGIIPYIQPTSFQRKLMELNPELLSIDPKSIFGLFRDIDKVSKKEDTFIINDSDYDKAQEFKAHVAAELPAENRLHVKTSQIDKTTLQEKYLEGFYEKTLSFLKTRINQFLEDQEEQHLTPLEIELQTQEQYLGQKSIDFFVTPEIKGILETITHYISDNTQTPMVLHGASGSGKSSLMAKAIEEAQTTNTKKVFYRFIGATPHSNSSKEILTSLFEELGIDTRSEQEKEAKKRDNESLHISLSDTQETFEQFSYRIYDAIMDLKEEIIIFIDAIDQLGNDDNFLWLPQNLPSHVKIIISALDHKNYEKDSKYFQNLKTKTDNLHIISPFTQPIQLLNKLLSKEHRTLQKHQQEYFLQQFRSANSPLYVTVAIEEIKHWRSFDATEGETPKLNQKVQSLQATQKGIIREFIENLSTLYHHDERFVHKVLGYLYASRDGLSESELLQLLATDENFIKQMAPETWHENLTKELPMVHWSRLHTQLKPFLSYKSEDKEELMYFFHREFEDVIHELYNQREEHEAIIVANQKLITQYQNQDFNANRWGKLYSTLITEYELRYHDEEKLENYSVFIAGLMNEKWIENYTYYTTSLHINYSRKNIVKLDIITGKSNLKIAKYLYKKNHNYCQNYILSLENLAINYKTYGEVYNAKRNIVKSFYLQKKLFKKNKAKEAINFISTLSNVLSIYFIDEFNPNKKLLEYANSLLEDINYFETTLEIKSNKIYLFFLVNVAIYEKNLDFEKISKAIDIENFVYKKSKQMQKIESDYEWKYLYCLSLSNLIGSLQRIGANKDSFCLLIEYYRTTKRLYYGESTMWTHQYLLAIEMLMIYCRNTNKISKEYIYATKAINILEDLYIKNPKRWIDQYLIFLKSINGEHFFSDVNDFYLLKVRLFDLLNESFLFFPDKNSNEFFIYILHFVRYLNSIEKNTDANYFCNRGYISFSNTIGKNSFEAQYLKELLNDLIL